ncbi:uncharacterized protein PgNI_02127 [Pyricularia grisea]|uniref:Uncharacterized protein n=1 Tax=Pyricularia grisea TaxID=148305 RepID=A0A6P8BMU6_PYRGI|nr:uncharacterized protein PgNI_02127 [Pyricularia grisea]TLD17792.1 hypothetical protein PgNI_02127 [Pyricularia grisea]
MAMIQNIHRHPKTSDTYPPIMGPIMGPRMVPTDQMDTARPLWSRGMSEARQEPKCQQHGLSAREATCGGEEQEECIGDVVDDDAAVHLAQRREDQGPAREAQHED